MSSLVLPDGIFPGHVVMVWVARNSPSATVSAGSQLSYQRRLLSLGRREGACAPATGATVTRDFSAIFDRKNRLRRLYAVTRRGTVVSAVRRNCRVSRNRGY